MITFFGSLFYIGITAGRALNGFLTMKFSDTQLIRFGQGVILVGIAAMLLPFGEGISLMGLILIGLGCAPIYPCVIHSTPVHFGEDKSQALIGVQMASAYTGTCLMPPLSALWENETAFWKILSLLWQGVKGKQGKERYFCAENHSRNGRFFY